jgi:LysM repeat protein
MTRFSLRKTLLTATIVGGSISALPTSALAQRYGAGSPESDLAADISAIQQELKTTGSRLRTLENNVSSLSKKVAQSGSIGQTVSYSGGNSIKQTPVSSGNGITHLVERGETLSSISRTYAVGLDRIAASNQLLDPHRLKIGQAIFIPGQGSSSSTPKQSFSAPASTAAAGTYVVAPGDTLSKIARMHGTSIGNPDSLQVGQKLSIGGASGASIPNSSSQPAQSNESIVHSPIYDDQTAVSGDEEQAPPGMGWYQVVSGDTLYSIAQDFGTTTRELRKINKLNSEELVPSQYLLVPVDDESLFES